MSQPKRKVTLYFHAEMLEETQREALRQDRSISWIIQTAWRLAREGVKKLPSVGGGTVASPLSVAPSAAPSRSGTPAQRR